MQIMNLFPTPVVYFNYDKLLTEEQLSFIHDCEKRSNEGNITSVNTDILEFNIFSDLKNFFSKCLQKYLIQIVQPEENSSIRITQSWLNYTKKGQWHHKHSHPNSFVSGVFYVNAIKDVDKIHFYKIGYQQIQYPIKEGGYNEYNSESWWLPVTSGNLIIFPSGFVHSVEPVETEETRISLSFNTFPTGIIGKNINLTELKL